MSNTHERVEYVIQLRGEDGYSRDLHLSQELFERLLASWKQYELRRGEPASLDEFFADALERALGQLRRTQAR